MSFSQRFVSGAFHLRAFYFGGNFDEFGPHFDWVRLLSVQQFRYTTNLVHDINFLNYLCA